MSARATAEDFAAARARLHLPPSEAARTTRPRGHRLPPELVPALPGRPLAQRGKRGSRLPVYLQGAIRAGLDAGHSVNSIALDLGVSHDAVRTVRDGFNAKAARQYAARKASAA